MRRFIPILLLMGAGCGVSGEATSTPTPTLGLGPFVAGVETFTPGEGAGFGQDLFPDIVLGPPVGAGERGGSTDVLSLGLGGEIVLRLGEAAVDGEGVDLLVFENAFRYGDDPDAVYAEPAQVAVSEDGQAWHAFPCAPDAAPWTGCAGRAPVLSNPDNAIDPTDPAVAGGDGFDLADVGIARARYVRITDRGISSTAPGAGFDLDAAAVVHGDP